MWIKARLFGTIWTLSVQAAFADKGLFECLVQGKHIALLLVNVYVTASLINF